MATIATLVIGVIGAAVAAYGAYSAAQAQQEQLQAKARAREDDAAIAEQAGQEAARRQRRKDKAALESFGARAAGRGVVAHEGSSLMSELDFATQSELEAQHVKYGYDLQAREKRVEASFAKWQAGKISPTAAMTTSLLSSAGSIAGSYATSGLGAQTGGGLNTAPGSAGMSGSTSSAYQAYRAGERKSY